MLQDIRSSAKGTTAKIIIGLIVISFSIFGIESLLVGGGASGVAEVNGESISTFELQQAVTMRQRQLLGLLGEDADPALLDDDRLRGAALESLVQRRILIQAAREAGLVVSEAQIGAAVASMEDFQIDGRFSPELYQNLLSNAGYTPAMFKQSLREDLLLQQLNGGLAASEFVTPAELSLAARVADEQRDLRYLVVPVEQFDVPAEVEESALQAYYEQHRESFMAPESVAVRYIELNSAQFVQPIPEERLREEFELTRDQFEFATESRVAHILFERGDDEDEADFNQRVASARQALEEGADFAGLAREVSDDIGSADFGGELGFTSGNTFPEPMEAAIAALQVGEISAPVQTEAGTHLIKLLERREGTEVAFADVRAELEQRMAQSEARSALLGAVEQLRDLAFNAEDLKEPAAALGVEVQREDQVQRNQASGLFAAPRLQSAIFSPEVLEQGYNTEVIELGPDQFVVARVEEYREPAVRPFEAVREQIAAELAAERAGEAALAAAQQALTQLRDGAVLDELANERGFEWQVSLGLRRDDAALPPAVRRQVFRLPAPQDEAGPVRELIETPAGDCYVVELLRVSPGDVESLPSARREQLQLAQLRETAVRLQREYESMLREQAEVTLY